MKLVETQTTAYSPLYESDLLRGIEKDKPWDLIAEIRKYKNDQHLLLDVGAGTAKKLLGLHKDFKTIYAVEPNVSMQLKAKENIAKAGVTNIWVVEGQAEVLPFEDNTIDVVTCMLAPHNTTEVHRVLKTGGVAILEKLGERDKQNIKECFGKDKIGWRGQFSYLKEGQREETYRLEFGTLFSEVHIRNQFWPTFYTMDGLILLLEQTPTIRNFDRIKDAPALEKIQKTCTTPEGIATQQNRMLIVAKK